ncbi:MAG: serine hydrolase domain-containing protein, partial [Mucilaginibacter sp.]
MDEQLIQAYINGICQTEKIPALTLSVWKEDDGESNFFSGFANIEKRLPVNADTVFQLGSISKLYTTILILKLVDEGLLQLNNTLCEVLGAKLNNCTDNRIGQIKLIDLLNHTSGLPFGIHDHECADDIIEEIKQTQLLFTPGSKFKYSTIGYSLLGVVAENTTG